MADNVNQESSKLIRSIEEASGKVADLSRSFEKINTVIEQVTKNTEELQKDLLGFQEAVQKNMTEAFDELAEHTQEWRKVTEELVEKGSKHWEKIKSTAQEQYEAIIDNAGKDFESTKRAWDSVRNIFRGKGNLITNGKDAIASVQELIKKGKGWVDRWNSIYDFGKNMWEEIKEDSVNSWDKIFETFSQDKAWLKEAWSKIKGSAAMEEKGGWKGWFEKISDMGKSVWELSKEAGKHLWSETSSIVKSDLEELSDAWTKISDVFRPGGNLIKKGKSAAEAIKGVIGRGKDWSERINTAKASGLASWDQMKTIGELGWDEARNKALGTWGSLKGSWGKLKDVFSSSEEDSATEGTRQSDNAYLLRSSEDISSGKQNSVVSIQIQKLVENINITGNSLKETASEIQEEITDALINALRTAQIQAQ